MDKLVIRGGKSLKGTVAISGAKNAALPLMAATILCNGKHSIENVPDLIDIRTMSDLLTTFGVSVNFSKSRLDIDSTKIINREASYNLVKTMRASVLTLGPLLARFGRARVSLPGGCAIGARPINLHLMGLERMGARINIDKGYVIAESKRLNGADIYFDTPTVTGTENIMMAGVLAKGTTRIRNAAREPEVIDLANALNSMGAIINGAGDGLLEVKGVEGLNALIYSIIPDRIETGTFIAAAGITESDILINGCNINHIDSTIAKLSETGIEIEKEKNNLRVSGAGKLHSTDLTTMPYPGFPTDMQAQFMALMSIADGTSVIKETIFENRYMHVAELKRMGANIEIDDSAATIRGVKRLTGAPVMATDLRASASLVIAALAAEGETIIDRIYHLDRGYEGIEEKLKKLGADINRVS